MGVNNDLELFLNKIRWGGEGGSKIWFSKFKGFPNYCSGTPGQNPKFVWIIDYKPGI